MKEIRLAWRIDGQTGNGLWRPTSERARGLLAAWVADGNARYGAGTHWIEEREA